MFIHGLTGNRRSTWTRDWTFKGRKETTFWPKELLPGDVKDVRILTWGYDADVVQPKLFRMASNNDIKAHAINLCTDLANTRTSCPGVGSHDHREVLLRVRTDDMLATDHLRCSQSWWLGL